MTTTSGGNISFSPAEIKTVQNIQFGVINPKEIEKLSVVNIDKTQIFDEKGYPLEGGLSDLRMGTCEKIFNCKTCQCNFEECPGHFGHIELAEPVYHVGFIEEIIHILNCVCASCSKILLDTSAKYNEVHKINNKKLRRAKIYNFCKGIKYCKINDKNASSTNASSNDGEEAEFVHKGCGRATRKYKRDPDNYLKILVDDTADDDKSDEGEKSTEISARECLGIFQRISDEDCKLLGFDCVNSRPEWMIITNLLVCPPQCRPSVAVDSTMRSHDDLSYVYRTVIKINNKIKDFQKRSASSSMLSDYIRLLQFSVATIMKNDLPGGKAQQRSGRPTKSISARLKGKEGRLRGNLMGKRVDYSARSVISPDPNLDVDELGVPLSVARNLTFPEVVNSLNIDRLKMLVENGPDKWPGAKVVIRDDGKRFDLRYPKDRTDIHLNYGDIVERHTCNGDYVLFNRQPSLHKMSMMGHRVHVLPYSTFRLNLSVTTPYNADFDGDEMNMHVPQSFETRSEIMNIMHVPKQIVSPQSNRPVMGIVQDTLIGVMLFTQRDNYITLSQVMNLLLWIKDFNGELPIPAVLKPEPLWTGKQIFSLILPQVNLIRFRAENKELDSKLNLLDNKVQILNGELIQGIICKKTVGNTSGGLIHLIWNEVGPEKTIEFLSNCQKIVNNWLLLQGWTVGVSDIISDEETNQNVRKEIKKRKKEVQDYLFKAHIGELECQPGKSMIESFEANANATLNNARESAGKFVQKSLRNSNHLKNMVSAGSKGNVTNISQIIACVGQQNVEGKRIGFNFGRRTLPHFVKDDFGPESKGFVENSYLSGLSPTEFFFHAMAGREGIIDTAIKTSKTGYIQRRLVKSLEDVMVQYDGTVRNSLGNVMQFLYGEDGMAGEFIEDQKLEILNLKEPDLKKKCKFFNEYLDRERQYERMCTFMEISKVNEVIESKEYPAIRKALEDEYTQILEDRNELRENIFPNLEDKIHIPINIPRIISNAKCLFKINSFTKSDINPLVLITKVNELKNELIMVQGNDNVSTVAQKNALKLMSIVINYNLCCKNIIEKERLTFEAFKYVLGEIKSRFLQAKVQPGESVGSIAAQSIGEPATQMTLNTFHFAGVSAKNVTLGVPRLEEIINVAKKLKTPSMTIYLKKNISGKEKEAQKIHGKLEYTKMVDIATTSEIYYDPNENKSIIEKDNQLIKLHHDFYSYQTDQEKNNISPWLLRIELDSTKLIEKNLRMETLEELILNNYENINLIASQENNEDKKLLIRMKYNENLKYPKEKILGLEMIQSLEHSLMNNLILLGVENIKKVYAKKEKRNDLDPVTKEVIKTEEWIIETDGSNMAEVFYEDDVDFTRSSSNDVNEIFNVLGIEATRKALIREVRTVLDPYGIYVNYRHIAILCDTMTQRGFLTSITRHGLSRSEQGPIRRCSFEQTVDVLLDAGIYGEKDKLLGISENILLGQLAHFGTGAFDLYLDSKSLMESYLYLNQQSMDIEDEKIINDDKLSQNNMQGTPYANNSLSDSTRNSGFYSFSVYDNKQPNFTPAYQNSNPMSPYGAPNSDYRGDSAFISTPNPNSALAPSSPMFNPASEHYRTPGPYSPLPYDKPNDYQGASPYSPFATSPGYNSGSVYTSNIPKDINTPKSNYSPTTPGIRNSGSPRGYIGSQMNSSSPGILESVDSNYVPSQYNPISPVYNGMASVYSVNSPFYNPNIIKEDKNEDEDNKENDNGK